MSGWEAVEPWPMVCRRSPKACTGRHTERLQTGFRGTKWRWTTRRRPILDWTSEIPHHSGYAHWVSRDHSAVEQLVGDRPKRIYPLSLVTASNDHATY